MLRANSWSGLFVQPSMRMKVRTIQFGIRHLFIATFVVAIVTYFWLLISSGPPTEEWLDNSDKQVLASLRKMGLDIAEQYM